MVGRYGRVRLTKRVGLVGHLSTLDIVAAAVFIEFIELLDKNLVSLSITNV